MKIKMTLCSDAVFGSGVSIPGGEDISVITDEKGFPYYKATAFKGVFREEAENLLFWEGYQDKEIEEWIGSRLGKNGDSDIMEAYKIRFSDLCLSDFVRQTIEDQIGDDPDQILRLFSYLRTFTSIDKEGIVQEGSLRSCRCLKKDLIFYGETHCRKEDEERVEKILSCMKWLGTMRNRGFGNVKIERIGKGEN